MAARTSIESRLASALISALVVAAAASAVLLASKPYRDRQAPRVIPGSSPRPEAESPAGVASYWPLPSSADEPRHPAPSRNDTQLAGLWIGLFGGFLGLTIQTLVNFAAASTVCFTGRIPSADAPSSWAWWVLLVATAIASVLAAASIAVAYRSWQSVQQESSLQSGASPHGELLESGEGRTRFMAMAGMVTSSILLATILFHGMAVLLSPLCRTFH